MSKYQGRRSGIPRGATAQTPGRTPGNRAPRHLLALYGLHAVEAALDNPRREVVSVTATQAVARRLAPALARRGLQARIAESAEIGARLAEGAVHQGVVAEVKPLPPPTLAQIVPASPLIALDQVTDPHNVGAILRSAAGFGAAAVIAPDRGAPAPSGALAKAASGALEHVPYVQITNLARTLKELKRAGYWIFGLDGQAETALETVAGHAPAVLVLGAEGGGLRRLTRQECDVLVRIALPGKINSLNVSNAAAIALYALSRAATLGPQSTDSTEIHQI
ncbi:MAG: 23S rRNA (guanosine(2251)-2'-O)-methyltransferase RlmB [Hyphomicrobiales bacterium]|nr:23S rRNA (guanosine(2251)-2'-O)-methyltransferase RlmB [Hyphomicrobiales bacterium]